MLIGNLLPLKDNFFEIFNVQPDRAVKILRFFRNFLLVLRTLRALAVQPKFEYRRGYR